MAATWRLAITRDWCLLQLCMLLLKLLVLKLLVLKLLVLKLLLLKLLLRCMAHCWMPLLLLWVLLLRLR